MAPLVLHYEETFAAFRAEINTFSAKMDERHGPAPEPAS
jgi:hypothetical protein